MIKKIFSIIALGLLCALPFAMSEASSPATVSPTPGTLASADLDSAFSDWQAKISTYRSAGADQKIASLKDLGVVLIDNRLSLMNNLKSRIESLPKTSSEDKDSLLADIEKNIADLEALKTRAQSETALEALKTDVRAIFDTYRIYLVVAPRDLGESLVISGNNILGKLQEAQTHAQTLITEQEAAGEDISDLQAQIKNVNNKLIDAQSQLNIANTKFKSMSVENPTLAITAKDEGQAAIRKAKDDLNNANTILKQIVATLKTLAPVASPSPAVSASPSK